MEDPFKKQEKLDIKIRVAGLEDWEIFKSLKVESLESGDSRFFGSSEEDNLARLDEIKKSDQKFWEEKLSGDDSFGVLALNQNEPIGIGLARRDDQLGGWYIISGFVKEDFRGGIGKKIFAARLREIVNRGGKKVAVHAKKFNERSIHIAESFGFQKIRESSDHQRFIFELEDVSNPEVIKKINEVLNAE